MRLMGFINKTPAGKFRANWRDPAGKQKARTFRTKKEANAYLAEVEGSLNKGTYVDPHAGRVTFGNFATRWLAGRDVEARTEERTLSLLRTHILPKWADWPLSKIDYMAVQEWVTDLGRSLAPATVAKCYGVTLMVLRTAVRARLIAVNPAEGVKVPGAHKRQAQIATITREKFFGKLLPAVPADHRAIVCAAAGAGLRWGECAGLAWGSVDLDRATVRVVQVAVETPAAVTIRPYPKTRAGVRTVPMPGFLVDALRALRASLDEDPEPTTLVFGDRVNGLLRRSNFRRRVWLPALVRAGLLGRLIKTGDHRFRAQWRNQDNVQCSAVFTTEREAVEHVALKATGALRFHDLRHSYATWLVSDGVPINAVQKVMGHQQASTTLNRYTHAPDDYAARVLAAFGDPADFSLTLDHHDEENDDEEDDPHAA